MTDKLSENEKINAQQQDSVPAEPAQSADAAGSPESVSESMEGQDQRGATIKESDIDPKAKAALKDLLGKAKEKDSSLTKVKVYSPFRVYYDNVATSVSAINGTGPFDILPGHKNFLTLLSPGDIVVRSATGKEETITIERGVMHVHSDGVQVFLDV